MPDYKKSGGKYITATVNIVKIDELNHTVITDDGLKIAVHNILEIV